MEAATQKPTIVLVRAVPYPPHKRRWCGLERWVVDKEKRPQQEMEELPAGGFKPKFDEKGRPIYAKHALPWPAEEIKVEIVDNPAPFDPNANGGYPTQISAATFVMLQQDERIMARLAGSGSGDSDESLKAKAQTVVAEEKLQSAQREIASLQEQVGAAHEAAAAKVAGEMAKLRQELAELRGKLAERKR
jgi:hypothetical protein